jgi:hypothetical protein
MVAHEVVSCSSLERLGLARLDWDGAGVGRRGAEKDQDGTLIASGIMKER